VGARGGQQTLAIGARPFERPLVRDHRTGAERLQPQTGEQAAACRRPPGGPTIALLAGVESGSMVACQDSIDDPTLEQTRGGRIRVLSSHRTRQIDMDDVVLMPLRQADPLLFRK